MSSRAVWPCNCYEKGNKDEPDLMWDLDLYARLDLADAWAVIGPINWYGPTSNLKLLFDRLVCANGGNPREDLIEHKNPELATKLEHSRRWRSLSINHLEGRSAGFFCYGDGGGDELDRTGRPKILRHESYFNPKREPYPEPRNYYAPLVWQCRYSGIEAPDRLWVYGETGYKKKYSDDQAEDMARDEQFLELFDGWTDRFRRHVSKKGKVRPAKYRAFGYHPPSHRWADVKLKWRGLRMGVGHPAGEESQPRCDAESEEGGGRKAPRVKSRESGGTRRRRSLCQD